MNSKNSFPKLTILISLFIGAFILLPISANAQQFTTLDSFERVDLGSSWNADADISISNGELAYNQNLAEPGWSKIAIYNQQTNLDKVFLRYGKSNSTADNGAVALLMRATTTIEGSVEGYLCNFLGQSVQLYEIRSGALGNFIQSGAAANTPFASSTLAVVLTEDAGGYHFEIFIDGISQAILTDTSKRFNTATFYSGIIFENLAPSRIAEVDEFGTFQPGTGTPSIFKTSGDSQEGIINQILPQPLVVTARDGAGPLQGVTITFAVTSGGGNLQGQPMQALPTNESGQASVFWTLGPTVGSQTVTASADGFTNSPLTFSATAMEGTGGSTASDDFNRENLGSSWSADPDVVIINNELGYNFDGAEGATTWSQIAIYNSVPNPTQLSFRYGTNNTSNDNSRVGFLFRGNTTNDAIVNGYLCNIFGSTTLLSKIENGKFTGVITGVDIGVTPQAGDIFTVATQSTLAGLEFEYFLNGDSKITLVDAAKTFNPTVHFGGIVFENNSTFLAEVDDFVIIGEAPGQPSIAIQAGNNQDAGVNEPLPNPLEVIARDGSFQPLVNVPISFEIESGGGLLDGFSTPQNRSTNQNGIASIQWTLGSLKGTQTVTASAANFDGSPLTFMATAVFEGGGNVILDDFNRQGPGLGVNWNADSGISIIGNELGYAVAPTGTPWDMIAIYTAEDSLPQVSFSYGLNNVSNENGGVALLLLGDSTNPASVNGYLCNILLGSIQLFAITNGSLGSQIQSQSVGVVTGPGDTFGVSAAPGASIEFTFTLNGSRLGTLVDPAGTFPTAPFYSGVIFENLSSNNKAEIDNFGTFEPPAGVPKVQIAGGNSQTGFLNSTLPLLLEVIALNGDGTPQPTVPITFTVTAGGGNLEGQPARQVSTGADGIASIAWTLGSISGANTVMASAPVGFEGSPLEFTATAIAISLTKVSGDEQNGLPGSVLDNPFVVKLADENDNPIQDSPIVFEVVSGGGTLPGSQTSVMVNTDANGNAATTLVLGPSDGENRVRATATEFDLVVEFTATAGIPIDVVIDNFNRAGPQLGPNWSADTEVFIRNSSEMSYTLNQGNKGIFEIAAIFNAVVNPTRVTFRYGLSNSPSENLGVGMLLRANSTNEQTVDGYLILVNIAVDQVQLFEYRDGTLPDPPINTVNYPQGVTDPLAGDVLRVDLSADASSINFDVFLRNEFVGQLRDTQISRIENTGANFAGVAFQNLNAGPEIDDFTLFNGTVPTMRIESGNNQVGIFGQPLSDPLTVLVHDGNELPIADRLITFEVIAGGGTLDGGVTNIMKTSDQNGLASVILTPGEGTNQIRASGEGLETASVIFTATGITGDNTNIIISKGNGQEGVVGTTLNDSLIVRVVGPSAEPISGVSTFWEVVVGDGVFSNGQSSISLTSDGQGLAGTKYTFGVATVTHRIEVSAPDVPNVNPAIFFLTAISGDTKIELISADSLTGPVGEPLPQPVQVKVTNLQNVPQEGETVTFIPIENNPAIVPQTSTTSATGIASATVTLGTRAGANRIQIVSKNASTTFTAFGTAGSPDSLRLVSGNEQKGRVGTALPDPLVVKVTDQFLNGIGGIPVTFTIENSTIGSTFADGSTQFNTSSNSMSDSVGFASAEMILGSTLDTTFVEVTSTAVEDTLQLFAVGVRGEPKQIEIASGNDQVGEVNTILEDSLCSVVSDSFGNPVSGVFVGFVLLTGDELDGGNVTPDAVQSDSAGLACASLLLGKKIGINKVQFVAPGLDGSGGRFEAEAIAKVAVSIEPFSGDEQSGTVGEALPEFLVVITRDEFGNPAKDVTVSFVVTKGSGDVSPEQITTDTTGLASTEWTLGPIAGENRVQVFSSPILQGLPIVFTAVGFGSEPDSILITAGDAQTEVVGNTLPDSLEVTVLDSLGNVVTGAPVVFDVIQGGGAVAPSGVVATNNNGKARVAFTLGTIAGIHKVQASVQNTSIPSVTFNITAESDVAATLRGVSGSGQSGQVNTRLSGPLVVGVRDRYGNSVQGFSVAFEVVVNNGSVEPSVIQTNANGQAASFMTLGTVVGLNEVEATGDGFETVIFRATGTVGPVDPDSSEIAATSPIIANGNAKSIVTVTVLDEFRNPISGRSIAVLSSRGVSDSIMQPSVATDNRGMTTALVSSVVKGTALITAIDITNSNSPIALADTAEIDFIPAGARKVEIASGNNQVGIVGRQLPNPISVLVTDVNDNAVEGYPVRFQHLSGGSVVPEEGVTDSLGIAKTTVVLGRQVGLQQVEVIAPGLENSPLRFDMEALHDQPVEIVEVSGDEQSGQINTTLTDPLVVRVIDQFENPVNGIEVTFTVITGGGRLDNSSVPLPVSTDENGEAQVFLTLGPNVGTNTVHAIRSGLVGSPVVFTAQATLPNQPPTISSTIDSTSIAENQAIIFTVEVDDPDLPNDVLTRDIIGRPNGANYNVTSGVFTWTPSFVQAGNYVITFTVTDRGGLTDSTDVHIVVNNVNRAPENFTLISPPDSAFLGSADTQGRIVQNYKWNRAIDPDTDDVIRYSIFASPGDTIFTDSETVAEAITDTMVTLALFLDFDTRYFWKVIASDDDTSATSNVLSFETINNVSISQEVPRVVPPEMVVVQFPGLNAALTFESSSGGNITIQKSFGFPPIIANGDTLVKETFDDVLGLPFFWDISTDMVAQSFSVILELGYDDLGLSGTIDENNLGIGFFSDVDNKWVEINTTKNTIQNLLTATESLADLSSISLFAIADFNAPTFKVGVFQNPIFSDNLDIFVIPSRRLKSNPTVDVDGVNQILQTVGTDDGNMYVADFKLTSGLPGSISIDVMGTDLLGNDGSFSRSFSASQILAASGGVLNSFDSAFSLKFDEGAIEKNTYLLVLPTSLKQTRTDTGQIAGKENEFKSGEDADTDLAISNEYIIEPAKLTLKKRAKLEFDLKDLSLSDAKLSELGIFRFDGTEWKYQESYLNEENKTISSYINQLGNYQLRKVLFGNSDLTSSPDLPQAYSLSQNFPNPFNPSTTIGYGIPARSEEGSVSNRTVVNVSVFNVRGRLVRTLVNEEKEPGFYSVYWDGTDESSEMVSSGIYIYRIQAGDFVGTKKMVLLK